METKEQTQLTRIEEKLDLIISVLKQDPKFTEAVDTYEREKYRVHRITKIDETIEVLTRKLHNMVAGKLSRMEHHAYEQASSGRQEMLCAIEIVPYDKGSEAQKQLADFATKLLNSVGPRMFCKGQTTKFELSVTAIDFITHKYITYLLGLDGSKIIIHAELAPLILEVRSLQAEQEDLKAVSTT